MSDGAELPALIGGDPSVELSSNRTSLSFERTRMSSDRTLMSTVRTSLSLIGFGFTLHEVFAKGAAIIPGANETGRNLGLALLGMGILLLILGIQGHARFDRGLDQRRDILHDRGLLRRAAHFQRTPSYLIALALLAVGIAALASITWRMVAP